MVIREYPQSPVAAVGGIIVRGGQVLLIRRGKQPSLGEWSIPGGAVEIGETLPEALRREVLEETGLSVRVGEMVEVLDRILRDDQGRVRFHYVLVDFRCSVESGEPAPASDVTELCWADRTALPDYRLRPDTLRVIRKALEKENRE